MDKEIFRQAGLTDKEADIYLILLESGEVRVGYILEKIEVSSSKVYEILERLKKKGLISEILKGRIRYLSAAPPQRLLDYLEMKKQQVNDLTEKMTQLIPNLEAIQKMTTRYEAKVYTGYNGLRTAFDMILQTLDKNEEYVGFMATLFEFRDPKSVNIFVQYHKKRALKGIKARLVAGEEMRELFNEEPFKSYKKFKIRFMPQQTLTNILIFRDNIFLYTGKKNPVGFILRSESLSEMFRAFFQSSWKISRK